MAYTKTSNSAGPPSTDSWQMYQGSIPDPNNSANTINVPQLVTSDGSTPAFGTQPTFTASTDQIVFNTTTGAMVTSPTASPTTTSGNPVGIDWSTAASPAAGEPVTPPFSTGNSIQNITLDYSTLASTENPGAFDKHGHGPGIE